MYELPYRQSRPSGRNHLLDVVCLGVQPAMTPNKPNCFNRPHYHQFVEVQRGWTEDGRRITAWIPDPMSKTCQQHGKLGEATLKHWDCAGCTHLHTASKSV